MTNRFSHITRVAIIALLFTGFAAHLAIPFFGDVQKNAFTQWLDHKIAADGHDLNTELRNQIRNLPKESANFWILVQDASKLILEHEEDFQLAPKASADESDLVFTWLIGQWSTFKHQQGNSNAVLPEIIPPVQKWFSQTQFNHFAAPSGSTEFFSTAIHVSSIIFSGVLKLISPPASGISINAP